MPKQLEKGMWFINKINPGTRKEYSEIWALDNVPLQPLEEFVTQHGAPVEPYLIYNEQVLAEPHEIGWWDEGEHTDELRDITLDDINYILRELDGYVDVEYDEVEDDFVIIDDKVVLSIAPEDDFDDWDVTLNDGLEEE
jgi:hypothetical protein